MLRFRPAPGVPTSAHIEPGSIGRKIIMAGNYIEIVISACHRFVGLIERLSTQSKSPGFQRRAALKLSIKAGNELDYAVEDLVRNLPEGEPLAHYRPEINIHADVIRTCLTFAFVRLGVNHL